MSPKPIPADELIRRAAADALRVIEHTTDNKERAFASRAAYAVVADLSKDLARHYRNAALDMKERSTNAAVAAKLGVSLHRLHLMLSKARSERNPEVVAEETSNVIEPF